MNMSDVSMSNKNEIDVGMDGSGAICQTKKRRNGQPLVVKDMLCQRIGCLGRFKGRGWDTGGVTEKAY